MAVDDLLLDDPRPKYRLCMIGFGLSAIAIGLLLLDLLLHMGIRFHVAPQILEVVQNPLWHWIVGSPITWLSLIGSYLLWGRWTEADWQRRAGLLVLMNGIDLLLWVVDHAVAFGLRAGPDPDHWFRFVLGRSLGWAEFALFISLAADVLKHFGQSQAEDSKRASMILIGSGFSLWVFLLLLTMNLFTWPIRPRRLSRAEAEMAYMIMLISDVLYTIVCFRVTVICLSASRHCGLLVKQWSQAERQDDLLTSRSVLGARDDAWFSDRGRKS